MIYCFRFTFFCPTRVYVCFGAKLSICKVTAKNSRLCNSFPSYSSLLVIFSERVRWTGTFGGRTLQKKGPVRSSSGRRKANEPRTGAAASVSWLIGMFCLLCNVGNSVRLISKPDARCQSKACCPRYQCRRRRGWSRTEARCVWAHHWHCPNPLPSRAPSVPWSFWHTW